MKTKLLISVVLLSLSAQLAADTYIADYGACSKTNKSGYKLPRFFLIHESNSSYYVSQGFYIVSTEKFKSLPIFVDSIVNNYEVFYKEQDVIDAMMFMYQETDRSIKDLNACKTTERLISSKEQ